MRLTLKTIHNIRIQAEQIRILELAKLLYCAINLLHNIKITHPFLLKFEKKLLSIQYVASAFRDLYHENKNDLALSTFFICKLIALNIIKLDNLLDNGKDIDREIILLKNKLSYEINRLDLTSQADLINKLFDLIIKDIKFDDKINAGSQNVMENIVSLSFRQGGYPSTLVGLAVYLGILSDVNACRDIMENESFETMVESITILARICDDIVSSLDNRNLVWKNNSQEMCYAFKDGVTATSVVEAIQSQIRVIKTSITELSLENIQEKFVLKVARFYFDYLMHWLKSKPTSQLASSNNDLQQLYASLELIKF